MKSRLAISFGEVVDRERKHQGEEASRHLGASGKEEFEIRGARASGQRVARAFLGLLIVLGQLALGPSPIGALRLGRLARGTEPGPMVPTMLINLLPTTYLGLPLGARHKSLAVWDNVEEKICRRLSLWTRHYISKGGRIKLIRSTLVRTPLYMMSIFRISKADCKRLEKIQRDFLWRGGS